MELTPLAYDVLESGLDDWVPRLAIEGFARQRGAETRDEITRTVSLAVQGLVLDGLIDVGDLADGGFRPWRETGDELLERIQHGSVSANEFAFWTRNTAAGTLRAQARK